MSEIRICKYCGMELLEDVPHGLRNCHLRAVARIAELEGKFDQLTAHDATERQDDKWIPVSERLPEDGEYVLAAFTDTILTATYHRQWTGLVGLDDWLDIEGRHSGTPTHWLPLPVLPESPNDTQTQTIVYGKESEE